MKLSSTHKQIRKIHRQTLRHGKRVVKIAVPITLDLYLIREKWEEVISASEWQKVERAIEKAWPGWFHVITKGGKHDPTTCPACKWRKVA